jgi:hypothetical protein
MGTWGVFVSAGHGGDIARGFTWRLLCGGSGEGSLVVVVVLVGRMRSLVSDDVSRLGDEVLTKHDSDWIYRISSWMMSEKSIHILLFGFLS